MSITVKQLRDMIEGLSDDTYIGLTIHLRDSVDELTDVELMGAYMGDDGRPRIAIEVRMLDEDDDEYDDDESEPTGSCDECGLNLYGDEHTEGLCDQCSWAASQ